MTTVHLLGHRAAAHGWWSTPPRDDAEPTTQGEGIDPSAEQVLEGLMSPVHAPLVLACVSANGIVARSCLRARVSRILDVGPRVVERFDASPTLSSLPSRRRTGDEPFIRAQLIAADLLVLPVLVRNSQVQEFRLWIHRRASLMLPGHDPVVTDCRERHR